GVEKRALGCAAERKIVRDLCEGGRAVEGVIRRDLSGCGVANESQVKRRDAREAADIEVLRRRRQRGGRAVLLILELQHTAAAVAHCGELEVVGLRRADVDTAFLVC